MLLWCCTYLLSQQYLWHWSIYMILRVSCIFVAMDLYIDLLSNQYMFSLFYISSYVINTGRLANLLKHRYFIIDLFTMNLYTLLLHYKCVWIGLHTCSYVIDMAAMYLYMLLKWSIRVARNYIFFILNQHYCYGLVHLFTR